MLRPSPPANRAKHSELKIQVELRDCRPNASPLQILWLRGLTPHQFANSRHERDRSPAPMKIEAIYNSVSLIPSSYSPSRLKTTQLLIISPLKRTLAMRQGFQPLADERYIVTNLYGNRIQFPDLLMVKLGSTGCQTYETCQIP